MMNRFVCIHGHFYQPPRDDPWMKRIERQPSAYPAHDWDERVHQECYLPNTEAEILNASGQVIERINNYEFISFNFGPTILSWMERNDPKTYEKILQADENSKAHFDGHGSAIAQVYNHVILPLASERDKRLQVQWGLVDFKNRFRREAEGIWLAETAVDFATLEVLCDFEIKFTILSPHQALKSQIDTRKPYLIKLPSGRNMTVFFYNAAASRGIAFDGLLNNGDRLADQLCHPVAEMTTPGISLAATDGESYGHHHKKGEMALAYAIKRLRNQSEFQLTNLAQFLKLHPATEYAEIHTPSSWSCAHGVERWRSNCGCRIGTEFLDQSWRTPLREALSGLKDKIANFVDQETHKNPRLAQALQNLPQFFRDHSALELNERESKVLELERNSQFMMTSCAWFFDEATGLEVRQNLKFADRALELFALFSPDAAQAEKDFILRLSSAMSHKNSHPHLADYFQNEIRILRKGLPEILVQDFLIQKLKLKVRTSESYLSKFESIKSPLEMASWGIEYWSGRITDFESGETASFKILYDRSLRAPKLFLCRAEDFSEDSFRSLVESLRSPLKASAIKDFESWKSYGPKALGTDAERALLHIQVEEAWNGWKSEYPRVFQSYEKLQESDPIWDLSEALTRFTST